VSDVQREPVNLENRVPTSQEVKLHCEVEALRAELADNRVQGKLAELAPLLAEQLAFCADRLIYSTRPVSPAEAVSVTKTLESVRVLLKRWRHINAAGELEEIAVERGKRRV
jgi:hypothetical protein